MPSQLTWIDHDAAERDRMNRILALFQERETRDELGLGGIRDSIADLLFPGTSTIQTRLRYFLFIPWLCVGLEREGLAGDAMAAALRARELDVRNALMVGDDKEGVIGRQAGAELKRGPSSVYWAGLGTWGLRQFPGSLEDYYRMLPRIHALRARQVAAEDEEGRLENPAAHTWHPDLPPPPVGFPDRATLDLIPDEAAFLRDLVARRAKGTLLAALVARAEAPVPDVAAPWEWPDRARLDQGLQEQLDHARWFSLVMNGAAILYNLQLAQKADREDRVAAHESRFADWTERIAASPVEAWSLGRFWEIVLDQGHAITPRTRRFVETWTREVQEGTSGLAERASARALVETRERQLKGPRSRFKSPRALDQWGGSSGVAPLTFRWSTVHRYLRDFHAALAGVAEAAA